MYPDIPLFSNPHNAPKISILEGPDSCGKTYLTKKAIDYHADKGLILRHVRCPDNRDGTEDDVGAGIRNVIMSKAIGEYPMAQAFLFMADFLYAYERIVKPELNNPNVKFIFDRFLPSTCAYQGLTIDYVNWVFKHGYKEFHDVFSMAHYTYLHPVDMERHTWRMSQKNPEEINHLDPTSEQAVLKQIETYHNLSMHHKHNGLLNSYTVDIFEV